MCPQQGVQQNVNKMTTGNSIRLHDNALTQKMHELGMRHATSLTRRRHSAGLNGGAIHRRTNAAVTDLLRQAADGFGSVAHPTPALQCFGPGIQHLSGRWKGAVADLAAERSIHADGAAPAAQEHHKRICINTRPSAYVLGLCLRAGLSHALTCRGRRGLSSS